MSDHGPVQEKYRAMLNALAHGIDDVLNPTKPNTVGFALLIFEFGKTEGGRVNYISNATREDMIAAMKEWIARAEGRVIEPEGKQ